MPPCAGTICCILLISMYALLPFSLWLLSPPPRDRSSARVSHRRGNLDHVLQTSQTTGCHVFLFASDEPELMRAFARRMWQCCYGTVHVLWGGVYGNQHSLEQMASWNGASTPRACAATAVCIWVSWVGHCVATGDGLSLAAGTSRASWCAQRVWLPCRCQLCPKRSQPVWGAHGSDIMFYPYATSLPVYVHSTETRSRDACG